MQMADNKLDAYAAYLFTFKAEEWNRFQSFLGKWSSDHGTTEKWSSGSSKSIPADVPIFLMKQGEDPTGIIAAGVHRITQSTPHAVEREKAGDGPRARERFAVQSLSPSWRKTDFWTYAICPRNTEGREGQVLACLPKSFARFESGGRRRSGRTAANRRRPASH